MWMGHQKSMAMSRQLIAVLTVRGWPMWQTGTNCPEKSICFPAQAIKPRPILKEHDEYALLEGVLGHRFLL
ncbi:hypothetical protein SAMN05421882_102337 [Nitrosomonas communis]|uniref:Uncharacterized protein n=1 Tax=Nitrosomonas communis TaxID=44574 RepID=A0A1H2VQC4_9PROT|nr:hypothetical protein SAMN05421882_102337 [Nitrosomonas communis]